MERKRSFSALLRARTTKATAIAVLLLAGFGASVALASPEKSVGNGPPTTVPGSPGDDCSRGSSDQNCRPDPSDNGQDCDDHGVARGNEDHCVQAPPTTTETSTTSTTTTTTTTTSTSTPTTTTTTSTSTSTPTTTTPTTTTSTSTPTTTTSVSTPTTPTTTTTTQLAPPVQSTSQPPASTTTPLAPQSAGQASGSPASGKRAAPKVAAKRVTRTRARGVAGAAVHHGELPFTGVPTALIATLGAMLLIAGISLRRVAARTSAE